MKLEVESIDIRDIQEGPKTRISQGVLYVNRREMEEILRRDPRMKSVETNIVYPGDRTRLVNIVDIIQPRCKTASEDEDFPGWVGKLKTPGQGKTRSLRGMSIVLSNRFSKRPYASVLDMFGLGAELSRYGAMKHISLDPIPAENIDERDFESAVKLAGLRTAVYVARAAEGHPVDHTDIYELDSSFRANGKSSNLPRVAYYCQLHTPQHDYQGKPDPILYGTDINSMLPTILHPNEILDGAVVNPQTMRCMDTYSIQNHAVIEELYRRHGKDLIFAGVVAGVASIEPVQRQRMAMMAANLISDVLGADGVVLTKVFGGMPHTDLALTAEECEKRGVKTTVFVMLWHSIGSVSDQIYFNSDALDAIINVGQICERFILPQPERILGGTPETLISNPDFIQRAGDKALDIEAFLLAGVIDMLGGTNTIGAEY
jgi:hypothetical protein